MANAAHILAEAQQTSFVSTLHNFPTRDLEQGIAAEVLDAVTSICKQQILILIWFNGTSAHMGHFSAKMVACKMQC